MKTSEINKLDEIWATIVKTKEDYICEHCKIQKTRMEAAHVVGRRHRATRWGCYLGVNGYDLCGHCLCHNCHQQYDEHGPREASIVERTIGVMRKALIQQEAIKVVAKYQDYDSVFKDLIEYAEKRNICLD